MSMASAADARTQNPPTGLVDACPSCCVNTEAPKSSVPIERGHRAGYECTDCGHAWTTDWRTA